MRTREKVRLEKKMKQQNQPALEPCAASPRVIVAESIDKVEAELHNLRAAMANSYRRDQEANEVYLRTSAVEAKLRDAISSEIQQAEIRLGYVQHQMDQLSTARRNGGIAASCADACALRP